MRGGRYRAARCSPSLSPPPRSCSGTPRRSARCAATRVGEGPGQGARRRLDPRQRDRGPRGDRAAAAHAAAGGRRAVAGRVGEPRRRAARHAPERARRRPQPQLRPPLGAAAGRPFDTYFPGRRAFSEPESRAVRRLVRRIRPDVSVWYHQHMRLVNLSSGADPRARARLRAPRRAARRGRCRTTAAPPRAGRTTRFPGTSSFVVELPAGPLSAPSRAPPRRAVLAAAPRRRPRRQRRARASSGAGIPFGAARRAQTRAYSERHYGRATATLQPEGDRRALHRLGHVLLRVQHVRRQRARRRVRTSAPASARTSSSTATGRSTSSSRSR